jgi:triphosphoribosyl-dephospho-CoA synthase
MTDVGLCAQLACVLEVTARKAGNVHRAADFADLTYLDFLVSAAAVAPILATATERRVGETVLQCVQATRRVVRNNTNLGMVLLLTPLAAVGADVRPGLRRLLASLDLEDSRRVFEAIRLAAPGGLGDAPRQDVRAEPTLPLREVMALAAGRDLIARQYANDFADVFDDGVPELSRALQETGSLESAIVRTHLHLMARHPDTLILRKRGVGDAEESARRAGQVVEAGWPHRPEGCEAFAALDDWLRAVGHQRNPGATADLVTACLFVLLGNGTLGLPLAMPWSAAGQVGSTGGSNRLAQSRDK